MPLNFCPRRHLHARAALGAVIASVTGDPRTFVSGGTEHQAPPGQAPIAAIVCVE